MTESDYQNIIRSMPCRFCGDDREGYVSWHHLRCLGIGGTGLKPPFWATIPVCAVCHDRCHLPDSEPAGISSAEQKAQLVATWFEIGSGIAGECNTWKVLGDAYGELMKEEQ